MSNTVKGHEENIIRIKKLKKIQYIYGRIEDIKWKTDTKGTLRTYKVCFEESSKKKREMKLVYV